MSDVRKTHVRLYIFLQCVQLDRSVRFAIDASDRRSKRIIAPRSFDPKSTASLTLDPDDITAYKNDNPRFALESAYRVTRIATYSQKKKKKEKWRMPDSNLKINYSDAAEREYREIARCCTIGSYIFFVIARATSYNFFKFLSVFRCKITFT